MFDWKKLTCLIFCGFWSIHTFQVLAKHKTTQVKNITIPPRERVLTVNHPPTGQLPENVYTSSDRYWILKNPAQNSNKSFNLKFAFTGMPGISNENKIILLQRSDSTKSWSRTEQYSISTGKTPFDGMGSINFIAKDDTRKTEFTLAQSASDFQSSQPGKLCASIKYGPVEISWQTQFEAGTKIFLIERKVENQIWQEIGQVGSTGISALPKQYQYEDASIFPNETQLKYRIKQVNLKGEVTVSQPIEVDYLPEIPQSNFAQAEIDTSVQTIQLKIHASIAGFLRVDLFDENMTHKTCLVKNEIIPGIYAFNIHTAQEKAFSATEFCRMEIISGDQKKSFIQIRQVINGKIF